MAWKESRYSKETLHQAQDAVNRKNAAVESREGDAPLLPARPLVEEDCRGVIVNGDDETWIDETGCPIHSES